MIFINNINLERKETDNDLNSQNVKIFKEKQDNQNNNENINNEAYPVFKNRLKELFNDFANEEGQNLNKPSVPAINFSEKILDLSDGCCLLLIFLMIILLCIVLIIVFIVVGKTCYYLIPIPALGIIVNIILCCNFMTIAPGQALVLTYYGKYIGTCKKSGFFWIRPCSTKSLMSLKSNHYNGNMIKVNDKNGTPALVGLVCVWRIRDTVKATYWVKDYNTFITGQTESAIRYISNKFSYDSSEENEPTLKSGA